MQPDADESRHRLLRRALQRRLAEVQATLSSTTDERRVVPEPASGDPEETLRVLMVRLLPKAAEDATTAAEDAVLRHLWALRGAALGDDLRFLDAWNNAYELLGARGTRAFLAEYAELLQWHVTRVAGS